MYLENTFKYHRGKMKLKCTCINKGKVISMLHWLHKLFLESLCWIDTYICKVNISYMK